MKNVRLVVAVKEHLQPQLLLMDVGFSKRINCLRAKSEKFTL